jgi:lathosterol oxidase
MGTLLYFVFATLSYYFVFDHLTFKHPRFLKNQVSLEIKQSLSSVPGMAVLTVPFFMLEVRGYTKMYDHTSEGPGFWYDIAQFPLFFMFTDFGIYWIHRGLHHPLIYKHLHKAHHKWIMPTPYAAIAFHPVDGWAQSLPYHLYPLLFPMQKWAYVFVFIFVQLWTIMIHDGEYVANNPIINGSACHSVHHFAFNYNYGQYFTIWDRIGGSYRKPAEELFNKETKMSQSTWKNQTNEADAMLKDVEGEDSRVYGGDAKKTQ